MRLSNVPIALKPGSSGDGSGAGSRADSSVSSSKSWAHHRARGGFNSIIGPMVGFPGVSELYMKLSCS